MQEGKVEFNEISDKTIYVIKDPESGDPLLELTGYQMQVRFNLNRITSLPEAEATIASISDILTKLLMENLIICANNKQG